MREIDTFLAPLPDADGAAKNAGVPDEEGGESNWCISAQIMKQASTGLLELAGADSLQMLRAMERGCRNCLSCNVCSAENHGSRT